MFSLFTKLIDRTIIRLASKAQAGAGTYPPNLEGAQELLARPDIFGEPVEAPAAVKWTSEEEFEFDSIVASPWSCNNRVYARLQRCCEEWQSKPTIVLVHGWNDEIGFKLRHPFQARRFLKAGFNVAQIELPYHLKRRPRGKGEVNDFLSEDLQCTVLAARQAVIDIRMLLAWLKKEGCARTGLLGVSLGGWLTGLVITHDHNVDFAVLNVPVSRMDLVVKDLAFAEPLRRSVKLAEEKKMVLNFEKLNLRSYRPKTPLDKILIIEAVDDLFASKEAIEEFWECWGKPEIWRVNHAHISGLFSARLLKRQIRWVAENVGSTK